MNLTFKEQKKCYNEHEVFWQLIIIIINFLLYQQILIQFGTLHLGLFVGRNYDKDRSRVSSSTSIMNDFKDRTSGTFFSSPAVQTYNPYFPVQSMDSKFLHENEQGPQQYIRSGVNTAMFLIPVMQLASIPLSTYVGEPFLPGNGMISKYISHKLQEITTLFRLNLQ